MGQMLRHKCDEVLDDSIDNNNNNNNNNKIGSIKNNKVNAKKTGYLIK
jgi:hypothetical protein